MELPDEAEFGYVFANALGEPSCMKGRTSDEFKGEVVLLVCLLLERT